MTLERALELLDASRRVEALEVLLAVWRATRAPAVADVIDVLSDDVGRALPAIEGKTRAKFQEAWLDVAGEGRAADVGRLLATFAREPCTQIPDRMSRLEAREHDPRVSRALVSLVARCPCTSTPNYPLWTRIFRLLAALGDVRTRALLAAKLAGPLPSGTFYELLRVRLEKQLAGLADPPALSSGDEALVRMLDERARAFLEGPPPARSSPASGNAGRRDAGPRTEEELLALVFADPGADGPRLVYADWLLERGDPRGELIALQFERRDGRLTGAGATRERALLRQHGRRWLGAIEPVIARDGVEFERGFVVSCVAAFRTKRQLAELVGHPSWGTVRRIEAPPLELCTHASTRALRVVAGVSQTLATALAEGPPLELEELEIVLEADGPELSRIARSRSLPHLRRIAVRLPATGRAVARSLSPPDFAWLLDTMASSIAEVAIVAEGGHGDPAGPDLAAWLAALGGRPQVKMLSFDVRGRGELAMRRDEDGWVLSANVASAEILRPHIANVAEGTFVRATVPAKASFALRALASRVATPAQIPTT